MITGTVFVGDRTVLYAVTEILYDRRYPRRIGRKTVRRVFAHFGFSVREQRYLRSSSGMSNAEIAGTLYITDSTVKFHIGNIFKKSGFARRSELITDYKLGNNH